jgi:hypothetical protein
MLYLRCIFVKKTENEMLIKYTELWHCATSPKIAGYIPDVIGFFN